VALLHVNGLQIRPQLNKQVVMNAKQAADLTAVLRPHPTIPHHYAVISRPAGDRLLTKANRNPAQFTEAASRPAPDSATRILGPGQPLTMTTAHAHQHRTP